jgi:hypothetical protein
MNTATSINQLLGDELFHFVVPKVEIQALAAEFFVLNPLDPRDMKLNNGYCTVFPFECTPMNVFRFAREEKAVPNPPKPNPPKPNLVHQKTYPRHVRRLPI